MRFNRRHWMFLLGFVGVSGLCGCRIPSYKAAFWGERPDRYERLEVVYRAHASDRLALLPPSEIRQVSATGAETSARDWYRPVLTVTAPHPDGREDRALAVLCLEPVADCPDCVRTPVVERLRERRHLARLRQQLFRERVGIEHEPASREIARMDISQHEVEELVGRLREEGYFQPRPEKSGSAELEVRLNQQWLARDWPYESSLDSLVQQLLDNRTPALPDVK